MNEHQAEMSFYINDIWTKANIARNNDEKFSKDLIHQLFYHSYDDMTIDGRLPDSVFPGLLQLAKDYQPRVEALWKSGALGTRSIPDLVTEITKPSVGD